MRDSCVCGGNEISEGCYICGCDHSSDIIGHMTEIPRKKRQRASALWILGGIFLLAALLLTGWNLLQDTWGGRQALLAENKMEASLSNISTTDTSINPDSPMPESVIGGMAYIGLLELDTLGLKLPILSRWSYDGLKTAPARYAGSVYQNDMVIAAHNYRSHFGTLKKLQPGDSIRFIDMDGNCYSYQVAEMELLSPENTEAMISGDWDLTLFTCTVGGTRRLTIRCERVWNQAQYLPT